MADGFAVWVGPVATIIASFTAAGVAGTFGYFQYRLGKAQKEVAQSQRDIAFDKLRFDAFKERYVLYVTARNLIKYLANPREPHFDLEKISGWFEKLDEAGFFFAGDQRELLGQVLTLAEEFMAIQHEKESFPQTTTSNSSVQAAARLGAILSSLNKLYRRMPKTFEADFGFSHLTGKK